MKQIKTLFAIGLIALTLCFSMSSCWTTKTNVGAYRETQGEVYTYAKGKQVWLFWGIIPLGRTDVNTPSDGNCQVITRRTFGDVLVSFFTLGLVSTYTIKIKAKKPIQTPNTAK
jgi:hypothetical protein